MTNGTLQDRRLCSCRFRRSPCIATLRMCDFYTGDPVQVWKDSRSQPVIRYLGRVYTVIRFLFGAWPIATILLLWPVPPKTTEQWAGASLAAAGLVSLAPMASVYPHYAAAFAPALVLRLFQSLATSWGAWLGWTGRGGVARGWIGRALLSPR